MFTSPPARGGAQRRDTDGVTWGHSSGTQTEADAATFRGGVGAPKRRVAKYTPTPTAVAISQIQSHHDRDGSAARPRPGRGGRVGADLGHPCADPVNVQTFVAERQLDTDGTDSVSSPAISVARQPVPTVCAVTTRNSIDTVADTSAP